MSGRPTGARETIRGLASERLGTSLLSAILFAIGGGLQVWLYNSLLPLLFIGLLAMPVVLVLASRREANGEDLVIFLRSLSTGLFAAGIASYYLIYLFDATQLTSDAWSFFVLSSQAGRARSIQDLQTITEGAGAVVLWSRFYDAAALLGFPRDPYVGISINVLMVALASIVCARSARLLYGQDDYRFQRLVLFFTISGILWLFAGIHIRDSAIFLAIVVLSHFWISYLSELQRSKLLPAVAITGIMMPTLQVLRNEFFYIPLLIAAVALVSLNFSRGRGDSRFIMLMSMALGTILLIVALIVFGERIAVLFQLGQETYRGLSLEEARSGSLGVSLIVDQILPIRLALGIPYLMYFPIPIWSGIGSESALQLFKSVNAGSFYLISSFFFVGLLRMALVPQLRSPAFVFAAITPLALTAMVALTSLESRHLGAFMSFFFLVGLLPDLRIAAQTRIFRLILTLVLVAMGIVHTTWFALRYA